jgi:methoxymalonate biosynthesis protein
MSAQWDRTVAVVGAGTMGSGITTLVLGHGVPAVLVDVGQERLAVAEAGIRQQLRHAQLMGALPEGRATGVLSTAVELSAIADADVVIEAVVESVTIKHKVLTEVAAVTRPGTPIVSNTSGIPIAEMASWLPRPDVLIGTHFMNPPYLIGMVEVSRGPGTGDDTVATVLELLGALGRRAVLVGDSPGFVTSRLLHPMINSAARLVGSGVATAEQVDELMQGCLGHPTGPLRTADLIGLDNLADSLAALYERTGDPACEPCDLLLAKVRDGDLGRKTGRGFHDYGKAMQ